MDVSSTCLTWSATGATDPVQPQHRKSPILHFKFLTGRVVSWRQTSATVSQLRQYSKVASGKQPGSLGFSGSGEFIPSFQDDATRRGPTVDLALNLLCASPAEKLPAGARETEFTSPSNAERNT